MRPPAFAAARRLDGILPCGAVAGMLRDPQWDVQPGSVGPAGLVRVRPRRPPSVRPAYGRP